MAENLGSNNGTTFHTVNMKPAAGEQGDSLWAKNFADNMASAFYKRDAFTINGPIAFGVDAVGRVGAQSKFAWFPYHSGHTLIKGTLSARGTDVDIEAEFTYIIDGTTIDTALIIFDDDYNNSFSWDMSASTHSDGDILKAEVLMDYDYDSAGDQRAWSETFSGWYQ